MDIKININVRLFSNWMSNFRLEILKGKKLWTCGTYAADPVNRIDPCVRRISPRIAFNKDDLPEPTCMHVFREIVKADDDNIYHL